MATIPTPISVLVVDADDAVHKREDRAWRRKGFTSKRVLTMQEAIALVHEPNDFNGIIINGDNIRYLPLLPILREFTDIAIMIAVRNFVPKDHNRALEAGADTYGPIEDKPSVNVKTCVATINSLTRSRANRILAKDYFHFKDLIILFEYPIVYINGRQFEFTTQEYRILEQLAKHGGKPVSYEKLITEVWARKYSGEIDNDLVKHAIKRMRLKMGKKHEHYIANKRDFGYYIDITIQKG